MIFTIFTWPIGHNFALLPTITYYIIFATYVSLSPNDGRWKYVMTNKALTSSSLLLQVFDWFQPFPS
jgi:hypothetical protein